MLRTLRVAAVSVLAVLAVAGCTAEDGPTPAPDASPSKSATESDAPEDAAFEADAEGALRDYVEGAIAGDPKSCALMSNPMKAATVTRAVASGVIEKGETCTDYVSALSALREEAGATTKGVVESVIVDLETKAAGVGTVVVQVSDETRTTDYLLVNTGEQWVVDGVVVDENAPSESPAPPSSSLASPSESPSPSQ